jgi:hypothetical protein
MSTPQFASKRFTIALGLVIVFLTAAIVYILVQEHNDDAAANRPMVKSMIASPVAPPPAVPSAEVVANGVHCIKFQNIGVGGGVQGIVLDEGSCKIGNVKYAIDTFQTKAGRDMWLRMATPYGVVPAYETDNAVVYKSVTS